MNGEYDEIFAGLSDGWERLIAAVQEALRPVLTAGRISARRNTRHNFGYAE